MIRRALLALSIATVVAGCVLFAWNFAWPAYSNTQAVRGQRMLERTWESEGDMPTRVTPLALPPPRLTNGQLVGMLVIPRIGLRMLTVQGTTEKDLEKGPGHYTGTVLPCERGVTGIAAHRTTYLAPFRHIDLLRPGDIIRFVSKYAACSYRVVGQTVVLPTDTSIFHRPGSWLVLTSCSPPHFATYRLIVLANLLEATNR